MVEEGVREEWATDRVVAQSGAPSGRLAGYLEAINPALWGSSQLGDAQALHYTGARDLYEPPK